MRTGLGTLVGVAVASSLATVGALELLREAPRSSEAVGLAAHGETPPSQASATEPLVPVPRPGGLDPGAETRLTALEQRIAALERGLASRRAPAASRENATEVPPRDELRALVFDWIAQEREQSARDAAREAEDAQRNEVEFDARYRASLMAREHGLAGWQEQRLVELFVEVELRRREIESAIDVATDDPHEVEARWMAFDEWAERREREVTAEVSQALYDALYGDE